MEGVKYQMEESQCQIRELPASSNVASFPRSVINNKAVSILQYSIYMY